MGSTSFDSDSLLEVEPWYQRLIDAIMIVAAPLIGAYVADSAQDLNRESRGVGGINRLHFLWLWVIVYLYALGLITPVARIYAMSQSNIFAMAVALLVNALPAAALLIPCYYGLAFLAGHHGETMHPAGRNMVGAIVLVFGFLIGAVIQFGWYWVFEKLYTAIFG